jgi:hypothetical protein
VNVHADLIIAWFIINIIVFGTPTRSWFAWFVLRGSFIVSNYTTITRFLLTGLFTVNI